MSTAFSEKAVAEIAVERALDQTFDYTVPGEMRAGLEVGMQVRVPLGHSATNGFVVGLKSASEFKGTLKPVLRVVVDKPLIEPEILRLALWMSDYYVCPLSLVLKSVLPGAVRKKGLRFQEVSVVRLCSEAEREAAIKDSPSDGQEASAEAKGITIKKFKPTKKQALVLEILEAQGEMPLQSLLDQAKVTGAVVKNLVKRHRVVMDKRRVQRDPHANLAVLPTEPLSLTDEQSAALTRICRALDQQQPADRPPLPEPGSRGRSPSKLGGEADCQRVADSKTELPMGGRLPAPPPEPKVVTPEPKLARGAGVKASLGTESPKAPPSPPPGLPEGELPAVTLLYGVTGSGKTEVYLQAIAYARARGLGAIVLVPEISLTPQTVERFRARFGGAVAVLHSHLSEGERHDEWHRIHEGEARLVIGPRSALFAPVRGLGLIVVDEEHETSYKQGEAPMYNARDVAVMRARLEGCAVVLGSATPAVESMQNVARGKYGLAKLTRRADTARMPVVKVVDMRLEQAREGRPMIFSEALMEGIRNRLSLKEQTILFLNRRGFSTRFLCPECGYVAECDRCSVSMTYYRRRHELQCNMCGEGRRVPDVCPECKSSAVRHQGLGTEKVEAYLAEWFDWARVQRVDSDSMRSKDSYQRVLHAFRSGEIDILVGTQMIAKGLHFPNVTLVGVVFADSTLHMPDFRASERTFQLLTQVAGRAGRGDTMGEVIVQTYTPQHPAVQAARALDYDRFFEEEIAFRKQMGYPPFGHLAVLTARGTREERVYEGLVEFGRALRDVHPHGKLRVQGPVPASVLRVKDRYRYQMIFLAPTSRMITRPVRQVLAGFKWPAGVKAAFDLDAMNMM